jgi:hypothetical protein
MLRLHSASQSFSRPDGELEYELRPLMSLRAEESKEDIAAITAIQHTPATAGRVLESPIDTALDSPPAVDEAASASPEKSLVQATTSVAAPVHKVQSEKAK